MVDPRGSRFDGAIALASGWIVVFLVAMASWFLLAHASPDPLFKVLWYILVAVAVFRAAFRTWRFVKGSRTSPGTRH